MVLTQKALKSINIIPTRLKLGLALKVTEQAVNRYILENKENGPLTKTAALNVIKKETDLTELEIFESEVTA